MASVTPVGMSEGEAGLGLGQLINVMELHNIGCFKMLPIVV